MSTKMPDWAQNLLDKHPEGERPDEENPMPDWLREELEQVPLWNHIRGSQDDPRFSPPHHLIEDIHRQPDLLEDVLERSSEYDRAAEWIMDQGFEHIVFIGCGSSYYASLLGKYLTARYTDLSADAAEAWEFYNYYEPTDQKTLVVANSATGGSFEVLEAVQKAREEWDMPTFALSNTEESPLSEVAGETAVFPAGQKTGPDISVITTRLMIMNLLIGSLGERSDGVSDEQIKTFRKRNQRLPDLLDTFLAEQEDHVQELAEKYHQQECLFVVGGGANWFSALEAGLKIEEESTTPCRAYQTADYPHMAISLLSEQRPTMVIAPPGKNYDRLHTCVRTAEPAGSPSIGVVVEGDRKIREDADDVIEFPEGVEEDLFPIPATVVGQLYGHYLGLEKGFNPDCLGTDRLSHAEAWLTSFPLGTH